MVGKEISIEVEDKKEESDECECDTKKVDTCECGKYDKWDIEDGLRTLTRAQEILNDDKLMAFIKKMGEKKVKEINSIADLRKIASSKE